MNFRHATTVSILILLFIFCLAVLYGVMAYRSLPDESNYVSDPSFSFPYNVSKPDADYDLPSDLEEISGLSWYKGSQVLAIQDEEGILYVFDLQQGKVVQEIEYGKDLDYEGVAVAGETVYVLERDGDIFQVSGLAENDLVTNKFETILNDRHETEGLGFDKNNNRLLVALKEHVDRDDKYKDKRAIYSFDLAEMRMSTEPVYLIEEEELGEIIYGKAKKYHFKPSGIAVHPETGDIYVVASIGKILIVLNQAGDIRFIQLLDPLEFRQPEGITFDDKNRLIISSEARGGIAKIKVFDPK